MFYYTKHSNMDAPHYVNLQDPLTIKCFITHITAIWTLPSMYSLMYLQIFCLTVSFITHITGIWTCSSMYTLMYLQITFQIEYFITQITAILMLRIM